MASGDLDRKTSDGHSSIWNRLIVVEIILLIIPTLVLLYSVYENNFVLPLPQLILICFTAMLMIGGVLILRGVITRFISIIIAVKTADTEGAVKADIQQDIRELREVRDSLTNIMSKLEKTASELNQRSFELLALKELMDVAKQCLDIERLQELVLDKIMTVTGARMASYLEYQNPQRQFRIAAIRGPHETSMIDHHFPMDGSPAKHAVTEKKSLLIKDIEADSRTCRMNDDKYGSPSFLSMPIILDNDVSAVVNLSGKPCNDHFDEDDERISSIMLREMDFALKNANLHFKVKSLLQESEKNNERLQEEIRRRMDSEEKLFHYQKNLERLVDEKTLELTEANEQLKAEMAERKKMEAHLIQAEKMEVLGNLAGGVAHDLNNVIGVLVGYSELFMVKIDEESPLKQYAAKILKSSERASAIIQDLLTMARRGVSISEVVNLNHIVEDYFKTLEFERMKAHFPKIVFQSDLEDDLLNVNGSPVHLGKTLMNLISNAVEAIPEVGDILIRTKNLQLNHPLPNYDTVREGSYVMLQVSDNGKGISQKDLNKIFEPFYTKKVMGKSGTGLGLTVVWGAVQDHKGYIDVQSTEGKGSTFTLYFPVTQSVLHENQSEPLDLDNFKGQGESILVVDDVQGQRELASSVLGVLNYRVNSVSSGEEAVEYLKDNKADLVILDMIMDPGMDGLDTYREIVKLHPGQKAILVSGYSDTERTRAVQQLGVLSYVRKPYMMEQLAAAVSKELIRI
jgi:signal transduction histidine kinase